MILLNKGEMWMEIKGWRVFDLVILIFVLTGELKGMFVIFE